MIKERKKIRAEAASWVARLHGPDRDAQVESGLRRWLAESPANATAFEAATDVWQETTGLPGSLPPLRTPRPRAGLRLAWAAGLLCLLATGVVMFVINDGTVATAAGEQRTLALPDGSRVELNTNTRLQVQYDERTRTIVLKSGEAYFDVARRASRPFIVVAGERRIVALGTSFVVRHDPQAVSVTLVDGRVAVSTSFPLSPLPGAEDQGEGALELTPGQRLSFDSSGAPILDTPPLERVTAWQRGQLIFENTPLNEAVAEFNRYGDFQIEIAAPHASTIPVGGVFRIGDYLSFVQAVAAAHDLRVVQRGERVLLTGGE
jgi:transmembrane sensor